MRAAPWASAASCSARSYGVGDGPDVDALDVLRDVEPQRALAEREAQPGIGAGAALVARDVEAPRAAEAVGDDRVEVGRGRLLRRAGLARRRGARSSERLAQPRPCSR